MRQCNEIFLISHEHTKQFLFDLVLFLLVEAKKKFILVFSLSLVGGFGRYVNSVIFEKLIHTNIKNFFLNLVNSLDFFHLFC